MKIRVVPRNEIQVTKLSSSKFKPLIDTLSKLEPGGDALQVNFTSDKELTSIRNIVYAFKRETGLKIKSGKDASSGKVYFFREK